MKLTGRMLIAAVSIGVSSCGSSSKKSTNVETYKLMLVFPGTGSSLALSDSATSSAVSIKTYSTDGSTYSLASSSSMNASQDGSATVVNLEVPVTNAVSALAGNGLGVMVPEPGSAPNSDGSIVQVPFDADDFVAQAFEQNPVIGFQPALVRQAIEGLDSDVSVATIAPIVAELSKKMASLPIDQRREINKGLLTSGVDYKSIQDSNQMYALRDAATAAKFTDLTKANATIKSSDFAKAMSAPMDAIPDTIKAQLPAAVANKMDVNVLAKQMLFSTIEAGGGKVPSTDQLAALATNIDKVKASALIAQQSGKLEDLRAKMKASFEANNQNASAGNQAAMNPADFLKQIMDTGTSGVGINAVDIQAKIEEVRILLPPPPPTSSTTQSTYTIPQGG